MSVVSRNVEQKTHNNVYYLKRYKMRTKTKSKSEFIRVRVNEEEKKLLQYHATQLNTTISDVVRKFVVFNEKTI